MRPPRRSDRPHKSTRRRLEHCSLAGGSELSDLRWNARLAHGSTDPGRGATGPSRPGAPALSTTSAPKTAPRMTTATIDAKTRAPELTSVQRPARRSVPPAR